MQTVGMAFIARNVEKTIKDCIESFIEHVDECAVVLAGESTDRTEAIIDELIKKYKHLHKHHFKWVEDFSAARNYSFGKIHTDWAFWVDADDTIKGAEHLREWANGLEEEVGAVWFPYDYAQDEFGNTITLYERERLLRMKYCWVWSGRLHETVSPIYECKYVRNNNVVVMHNHLAGASRHDRNMSLLKIMLEENPEDKRIWLYLGHQNYAAMNWMEGAKWFLRFGQDKGAVPLERYQALCYASKALRTMEDYPQSLDVAMAAVTIYPDYKDAYIEAAHSYMMMKENDKAIHFAQLADNKELMREPPSIIFVNPTDYTFRRCAIISECYEQKGDLEKAHEWALKSYGYVPHPALQQNITNLRARILREKITEGIRMLAVELVDSRESIKLKQLREATPSWFRETPDYLQLLQGVKNFAYEKDGTEVLSKPDIVENGEECIVNLRIAYGISNLLKQLDEKYKKVTIISPSPNARTDQFNALSQVDMEHLMIEGDRHIINLRQEMSRVWCEYDQQKPTGLFVKFYVGQGLEHWNPQTIRVKGCGGSETAVAKVSAVLAEEGHSPVVYAMDNQIWDGVMYRSHEKFTNPECDWFISSRIPDIFNSEFKAGQKWLWVHDIHCWDRLTPDNAAEIDVIIALSHWHADHLKRAYPFLAGAEVIDLDDQDKTYEDEWTPHVFHKDEEAIKLPKIAIIGNGIDTERFENISREKIPHSFIWMSSPDRGLEELLGLWGLLREKLPDATLKIFYGWDYFDKSLHIPEQREFKERIRTLIQQPGVQWCDRIGQAELAIELGKTEALVYPPPHQFRETYGIAFLEAQAAGTLVFYRQNGALGETIGNRGVPLAMDLTPPQIVDIIYRTLDNKVLCARLKKKGMSYAMKRTWKIQALKMLRLYEGVRDDKGTTP